MPGNDSEMIRKWLETRVRDSLGSLWACRDDLGMLFALHPSSAG
jgi:hypothetical protein